MKLTTMAIMLAGALTTASAITPVDKWGRLQAKGGKLYDATGSNQVILRGMSLYWSSEASGNRFYNPQVVDWLYSDFKASIIRIPVAPTATSTGGKSLNNAADSAFVMPNILKVIDECIAQGIYVLVDWHVVDGANQSTSTNPQTDFAKKVFGYLAKKYKDSPNVLWEVWNEPTGGDVVSHANSVISTIRAAGNKNLVIVGSNGWSSEPNTVGAVTDPLSPANVAYTIHFYAAASDHNQFKSRVTAAVSAGRTVFATEFGTTDASGDNAVNTSNADDWISILETNGVSWCNWDVGTQETQVGSDKTVTQTSSIFKSTAATPFGNWPLTDLGTSGTWVRNKIRGSVPNNTFTVRPPPDTTIMPSATDTAYATKYVVKTNIDTAASTDGGSKGIISSTASGSGQSAIYRVTTTTSSSYMAWAIRLKGGATGGSVKLSINGVAVDSFKVAAGAAWTTIYDSAAVQWATIGAGTFPLQLDFTGDVSFHWLVGNTTRFGWKPAGVVRAGGASLAQHVVAHHLAGNLVLDLPAGHDWAQVSLVDAQGKRLASAAIAPKAQQVSLPSGSGLTWVVFDGPSGKQSMAVAPAR